MRWSEFAVKEARFTFREYEQRWGEISPPVPVEDIADLLYHLAIDSTNELPTNIAGRFYPDRRVIEVRKSDILARQRFTIAHEIGHYRLHIVAENLLGYAHSCEGDIIEPPLIDTSELLPGFPFPPPKARQTNPKDMKRIEIEANIYAAELLMPSHLVEQEIFKYGSDIPKLSKIFHVSQQAMRYRLEKLLFIPPEGPQLTLF